MKLTIRVDGGRASGKTTLVNRIEALISASGYDVIEASRVQACSDNVNMEEIILEVTFK